LQVDEAGLSIPLIIIIEERHFETEVYTQVFVGKAYTCIEVIVRTVFEVYFLVVFA
jgi:hypothetical protein